MTMSVYLATSASVGHIKIGKWSGRVNDLLSRYKMYFGASTEVHYFVTPACDKIEKEFISHFEQNLMCGELFTKHDGDLAMYINYFQNQHKLVGIVVQSSAGIARNRKKSRTPNERGDVAKKERDPLHKCKVCGYETAFITAMRKHVASIKPCKRDIPRPDPMYQEMHDLYFGEPKPKELKRSICQSCSRELSCAAALSRHKKTCKGVSENMLVMVTDLQKRLHKLEVQAKR